MRRLSSTAAVLAAMVAASVPFDALAKARRNAREHRHAVPERRPRGFAPVDENGCIGYIDGICVTAETPGNPPLSIAPITSAEVGSARERRAMVLGPSQRDRARSAAASPSTKPAAGVASASPATQPVAAAGAPTAIDAAHRQTLSVIASKQVPLPLLTADEP